MLSFKVDVMIARERRHHRQAHDIEKCRVDDNVAVDYIDKVEVTELETLAPTWRRRV